MNRKNKIYCVLTYHYYCCWVRGDPSSGVSMLLFLFRIYIILQSASLTKEFVEKITFVRSCVFLCSFGRNCFRIAVLYQHCMFVFVDLFSSCCSMWFLSLVMFFHFAVLYQQCMFLSHHESGVVCFSIHCVISTLHICVIFDRPGS